jgi:hypothetical protein
VALPGSGRAHFHGTRIIPGQEGPKMLVKFNTPAPLMARAAAKQALLHT